MNFKYKFLEGRSQALTCSHHINFLSLSVGSSTILQLWKDKETMEVKRHHRLFLLMAVLILSVPTAHSKMRLGCRIKCSFRCMVSGTQTWYDCFQGCLHEKCHLEATIDHCSLGCVESICSNYRTGMYINNLIS